jgi:transmembrane sensor
MKSLTFDPAESTQAEQAALWCMRLSEGRMTREDENRFSDWLEAEPAHTEAFEQAAATWQEVHAAEAAPEFLRLRVEALESLQQRHRERAIRLTRRPLARSLLAAAPVAVTLAAALLWWTQRPEAYSTGLGERRVVRLQDGSSVSLDASTEVTAKLTRGSRVIHLIHGRAKFDVSKDPLRPFSVAVGDRVVVAIGTAFSVELVNKHMQVVLYEGRVSVLGPKGLTPAASDVHEPPPVRTYSAGAATPQELTAGQELDVELPTAATRISTVDRTHSLAWESGQLEFVDEPLATAVERMNRYPGPRLAVGDARAGSLLITGVFASGDTQSFVEGVTAAFPVRVEIEGETRVLRSKSH